VKHVVAAVRDVPPGERVIVEVGKRSIGIFNVDGEFFALRNRCPHQGAALCEGKVWGEVDSSGPGDIRYDPGTETVSCPWHGWEFHIRTGQSWCEPDKIRTAGYDLAVTPGREIVDEGGDGAKVKGPYVAETFAVSVEEDYIILETA
jgi:nitrite reductase/ring-hydroxylating ferredoxin subunit